jgi:hypothetical protein
VKIVKNVIFSLKPSVNFKYFFNISVVITVTHSIMHVTGRNRLLRVFYALEKRIDLKKTPQMGENGQKCYL